MTFVTKPEPILSQPNGYFSWQIHCMLSDLINSYEREGIHECPGMTHMPAILYSSHGICRIYQLDQKICDIIKTERAQLVVRTSPNDDGTTILDLPFVVDENLNSFLNDRPSEESRRAFVELAKYVLPHH